MPTLILTAPIEGWVVPLEAVPDAVFADRMLGDGIAIDPTGDSVRAPCDAVVQAIQPTGHAVTLATAEGAEILIHVGIDTVALAGRGFAPCVAAGDRVRRGDPLIRIDLDLLARTARAVVTPIVVTNGDAFAILGADTGRTVGPDDAIFTLARREAAASDPRPDEASSSSRTIVVPLAHGIHARPAARIAALARSLDAAVTIAVRERTARADSVSALLALGVANGDRIVIGARGNDRDAAVAAIADLILDGMEEAAAPAAAPVVRAATIAGALSGVTASPGLAIGRIARLPAAAPIAAAPVGSVAEERAAFATARAELAQTLAAQADAATGTARAILAAHGAILDDPALVEIAEAHITAGMGAVAAWRRAIEPQVRALREGGNARLAERADDLRDIERRLLVRLAGVDDAPPAFAAGTILAADDLLPSQLMALAPGAVAGLCTTRGGPTAHVAILAAGMGLPALVAIGPALAAVAEGTRVVLDASGGLLHIDPDAERLAVAEAAVAAATRARAAALARAGEDCRTADGVRIEAFANVGSREDARQAMANGAEGSGLLRTEFLFLERDAAPDVGEQTRDYQAIADALEGRPLIVRLLDIGGDKPAPYLPIASEENPALGLRGIRTLLAHPQVLRDQIRAILAVRPAGQCRIMLPMVATLDEVRAVRAVLDEIRAETGAAPVPLGVMIETPAAALTADLLAREVDFLSIGTNDLTQYVLAMDRGNAAVADALDGLHPAVLRLIGETCRGAGGAGRWTGVCGGLASDPLAVPILIGLGVTELSSAPAQVPAIKALVRGLTLGAARAHAGAALACGSAAEVRALAREFAVRPSAPHPLGDRA